MTPSCSSAVTFRQTLQRHLELGVLVAAGDLQKWLRVKTSSETMVIRCSSVSTLTRIDWLAILSASWTSVSMAAAFLAGFALASFAAGGAGAASGSGAACLATGAGAACLATGAGAGAASVSVSRRRARGRRARLRPDAAGVPAPGPPACLGNFLGHRGLHRRCGHDGDWCGRRFSRGFRMAAFGHRVQLLDQVFVVPSGSVSVASRPAKISLMRSIEDRISVTASA